MSVWVWVALQAVTRKRKLASGGDVSVSASLTAHLRLRFGMIFLVLFLQEKHRFSVEFYLKIVLGPDSNGHSHLLKIQLYIVSPGKV